MSIQRYKPETRFSEAVTVGDLIFLSGQIPTNPTEPIREQTQNVLDQIENLLLELGSDKNNLVDATVYLKTMDDFAGMNEVWDSWFSQGCTPCRACVEANLAKPEWKVEIKVIAAKKAL